MRIIKHVLHSIFSHTPYWLGVFLVFVLIPENALAEQSLLDSFNLAPFVPLVLETMMNIATSLYKYFVGDGTGWIYIFIYAFLAFYLVLYLVKMYFPKDWLGLFGFSGGGEMWDNKTTAWSIAENVLKPCLRAIIAGVVLLQIKPIYVTNWLVNPFLEFGAIYTNSILQTINPNNSKEISSVPICPASIEEQGWISKRSCDFLIQPVYTISKENNRVIAYGFDFLKRGLRGLITPIPHGGEDFLNTITGIVLIAAFVSSNLFMALLIIQGIFDFCLALIMYPFKVLAWVAKKSDAWFDVLPVFNQIIDALKKLIITMIACAFILCINIALVRALFNWSSSSFIVASGGVASSNVPTITNSATHFGQHSMLWLSSILTFFLMYAVFKMTRERLDKYSGIKHDLYNDVTSDGKRLWEKVKATPDTIKTIFKAGEKITKKK